jgi:peptidyl-prolyl cis-trans isomerase D
VAAVTPAHDRTLDDVKPQVEQQWRAVETATRLKAKADELLDKLKGGTPFDLLAATNGLRIATAADFKRGGVAPGLSPRTIEAAFRTPRDTFGSGEGADPSQWAVFRVTDVKTPPLDANVADGKGMQQTVQRQLSDDMIGQYVSWLENELGTTVNSGVLAQALGSNGPDTN